MKNFIPLLLLILLMSANASGQWTTINLPQGKASMGAVAYGSKLWFAGGYNTDVTNQVDVYDVFTGEWSMKQLSIPRMFTAAGAAGGKLFFAGGINFNTFEHFSRVDIFDTLTQVWTTTELPEQKFDVAAIDYGDKVYFAGGVNLATGINSSTVDIYDTATGTWTAASLSAPGAVRAVATGSKLIFVGAAVMDIYDTSTDTWTVVVLPDIRPFAGVVALNNQIIVAGGMNLNNTPSDRVDIYDLGTEAWTISNLSVPRGFINASVTICGKAFFAGGGTFDFNTNDWISSSNQVDIYDPSSGEWTTNHLSHAVVNHSVVASGNQVFIAGGYEAPLLAIVSAVDIYTCPGTLLDAQFVHDDSVRTYKLYVPADYDGSEAWPLVIALHGSGQTNDFLINFSRMNEVADAEHFLVAYPQALWVYDVTAVPPFSPTDVAWNTGGGATSVNDDVGFLSRMIHKIGLSHRVDPARVYACGLSSGGQMSYRLACELSDQIAAFASVSGMMPADVPCSNGRPVPLMEIHGTADPIVPFDGIPPYNLSIPDGIAFWVDHNGCDATPTVTQLPDLVTTDNSTVTVKSYGNCDAGTEVLLYEIVGGGHPWPGSSVPFVPPFLGQRNEDINGSLEIWNFFKKHKHPNAESDVWKLQTPNLPVGENLFGLIVSIVDENTAWMAPEAGDISVVPWNFGLTQHHFARTTDGGNTWIPGTYPTSGAAITTSLFAFDDKKAWLTFMDFAEGPKLLKTTDGGQNWTSVEPGLTTFPAFVHFFDANNGIVACDADADGHVIFRTSDGGNTWQRIAPSSLPPTGPGDGIFPWYSYDGDHIWVVTLSLIMHSANKGVTWESWNTPIPGPNDYIACQGNTCLISYGDYSDVNTNKFRLFRTKNKGASWEEITPVDDNYAVNGMKYVPRTKTLIGAFVGHNVDGPFLTRVSYDDGSTWQTIDNYTKVLTLFFYDEKTGYGTQFNTDNSALEIYRYNGPPLTARVQFIHAADHETVKLVANGETLREVFAYQTATPFINVPPGVPLNLDVIVRDPWSTHPDGHFTMNLSPGKTYIVVLQGTFDPNDAYPLALATFDKGRERGSDPNMVDFLSVRGGPDIPAPIDVVVVGGPKLADDVLYGQFGADYVSLPAGSFVLSPTPADNNDIILDPFQAHMGFWKGRTAVSFGTGFVLQGTFQPWVALSNGGTFPLYPPPGSKMQAGAGKSAGSFRLTPNPAREVVQVIFDLQQAGSTYLEVFDANGVRRLQADFGDLPEGWHAFDLSVGELPEGVYFVKAGGAVERLVVVR